MASIRKIIAVQSSRFQNHKMELNIPLLNFSHPLTILLPFVKRVVSDFNNSCVRGRYKTKFIFFLLLLLKLFK